MKQKTSCNKVCQNQRGGKADYIVHVMMNTSFCYFSLSLKSSESWFKLTIGYMVFEKKVHLKSWYMPTPIKGQAIYAYLLPYCYRFQYTTENVIFPSIYQCVWKAKSCICFAGAYDQLATGSQPTLAESSWRDSSLSWIWSTWHLVFDYIYGNVVTTFSSMNIYIFDS